MNTEKKLNPEMITFYNSTKSGVDTIDWINENYSVALAFYSILLSAQYRRTKFNDCVPKKYVRQEDTYRIFEKIR